MSDIPCQCLDEGIVAQHVKQATNDECLSTDSEGGRSLGVGIDGINSDGVFIGSRPVIELYEGVAGVIADGQKVSKY